MSHNKENEWMDDSDDLFDVSRGNASQLQVPKLTLEGATLEDSTNLSSLDITPDLTPTKYKISKGTQTSKPVGILKQKTPLRISKNRDRKIAILRLDI